MLELDSLREREKELLCLYKIQQLTLNPSQALDSVFEQVVETLGEGWQRPESTGACLEYFGRHYQSLKFDAKAALLSEVLRLGEQEIGRILVSDSCPDFQIGSPDVYLPEERKLLKSVANLLSNFVEWRHLEVLGKRLSSTAQSQGLWRERLVEGMVSRFEPDRFGACDFYLAVPSEHAQTSHASKVELHLFHRGSLAEKERLSLWLEGWSLALAETATFQTGAGFPDGIFDLRWSESRSDGTSSPALRLIHPESVRSQSEHAPQAGQEQRYDVEEVVHRTLLALSHELRNPLTVIAADLDILQDNIPLELRRELVAELHSAVNRIKTLLTDLMLFLRAETGVEKPPLEEVELAAFVASLVSRERSPEEQDRVVFSTQDGPLLKVRLNRKITERILRDLINNAIRYSDSEKVEVSVISGEHDQIVLSVKDEGCGIDEIHHDKLFEQFYRLELSRDRASGGVGLGLPLARALARSQSSRLEFTSCLGVGTEVRLVFQRI